MMVLLVVVVVDWVGAVLRKFSRQIAGLSILKCRRSKRHGFDSWVGKIPWSRKWQLIIFFPGEFHGQRSMVGYSPWDHKELGMTE